VTRDACYRFWGFADPGGQFDLGFCVSACAIATAGNGRPQLLHRELKSTNEIETVQDQVNSWRQWNRDAILSAFTT
jgi:hypothetical protein